MSAERFTVKTLLSYVRKNAGTLHSKVSVNVAENYISRYINIYSVCEIVHVETSFT